jgi:hypothetical protein
LVRRSAAVSRRCRRSICKWRVGTFAAGADEKAMDKDQMTGYWLCHGKH